MSWRISFFLAVAVIGLTGCANSTLDRAISICADAGNKPSYQRSDVTERFQCQ